MRFLSAKKHPERLPWLLQRLVLKPQEGGGGITAPPPHHTALWHGENMKGANSYNQLTKNYCMFDLSVVWVCGLGRMSLKVLWVLLTEEKCQCVTWPINLALLLINTLIVSSLERPLI